MIKHHYDAKLSCYDAKLGRYDAKLGHYDAKLTRIMAEMAYDMRVKYRRVRASVRVCGSVDGGSQVFWQEPLQVFAAQ